MKIIVIGLGQVGQELVKELIQKNHDVTVIDLNKELLNKFTNKYEVNAIVGSGASKEIQTKAKCELADIVIALTDTDEIIVFNEFNGVEGYKINLDTGGTREIKNTITKDAIGWDGATARYATLLFDTDKLAVIDGTTCKILQLNGDGTYTELFNQAFNYGYGGVKGIFEFNGYLYFSVSNTTESTTGTRQGRVLRVDLSTSSYTSTTILNTALTIIGGIPSGWELSNICINGYHNGKFYVTNALKNRTIVCTDIADVCGTMIGCFEAGIYNFDIVSTTNKPEIFIGGYSVSAYSGRCKVQNNMLDTTVYVDTRGDGSSNFLVWISESLYSNYWTLYPLSSALEKTAEDTVEVLYDIEWKD